jgi:hypothetical protein
MGLRRELPASAGFNQQRLPNCGDLGAAARFSIVERLRVVLAVTLVTSETPLSCI